MNADKIRYCDEQGFRVLDLRPDGVECIPVLRSSDFSAVRRGAGFHVHPGCVEFTLCLKGNLTFDTPDREYPFLPGSIFVSAPDEPHHLRNNPSGLKTFSVLFAVPGRRQRILGLDARGSEWLVRSLTHLPKRLYAGTPEVKASFRRLFDVYDGASRRSPSRRVKMRAAALDLLIAFIDASRRLPGKSSAKIDEIARRIKDAPAADYPVGALARECGVSVSTFSSSFKRSMGLPLHSYVLNCRVDKASRMLAATKRSVLSISQELGFYSTQHSANTFRRVMGVAPAEYRAGRRWGGR